MRLVRAAARDGDHVAQVELARFERLPVDEADDRPQQEIDEYDEGGRERGVEEIARAGKNADRSRAPQRGGDVEPAHVETLAEDQAGPEEADPRHHLGRDPRGARVPGHERREDDEGRRAQRHQRIGAQARQPVAPLALEADDGAQPQGRRQVDRRVCNGHRHRR
jgi:hypothetical protein